MCVSEREWVCARVFVYVCVCMSVREKVCSTAHAVIFSILNAAHEGWCVCVGGGGCMCMCVRAL